MRNLLRKNVDICISLKNNKAQIIISIAILIVSLGIAFSFFKGNSSIHINKMMGDILPGIEHVEEFELNNASTNNVYILE